MSLKISKIRLFYNDTITKGDDIVFNRDQSHYLSKVMRLKIGDTLDIFNGVNGAWKVNITNKSKKSVFAKIISQTQLQHDPPDLWILFAPIKKNRTQFIIEKATELGAAKIIPVKTDFTNSERIKRENLYAHAIEAAEQCGGTFVPNVEKLCDLKKALRNWPDDRGILFCNEALAGEKSGLPKVNYTKWAILIGPEGGFSDSEKIYLNSKKLIFPIDLGPRILRADTAVVAAISLWQKTFGDWK